jgi:predicted CXXCH cytochrome family protein
VRGGESEQPVIVEPIPWGLLWVVVGVLGLLLVESARSQDATPARSIELGTSCVTSECHTDLVPGPTLHGPVNVGNCAVCHEAIENRHEFRLARSGPELCGFCHQLTLRNVVHAPVREGNCTGCHDPHRSDIEHLLIQSPSEGLCQRCHQDDPVLRHSFLHAPVAAGLCILCHEPHSSWNLHLVTRQGSDLCMFCHSDEFNGILRMRHVHEPVRESCLDCHNPHGAETATLTNSSPPELCYSCHESLKEKIASSRVVHGAVSEKDTCTNCHDPHGSPLNGLLRQSLVGLCLGCHDKPMEATGGGTITDMATLLATSRYLHGPVRNGACTACHDPHASQNFRCLAHDYPERFYAPFRVEDYSLCFMCHSQAAFLSDTTQTLTNFRNGTRNLHFVHVNDPTRGRTCRACHEVHASNHPFHIRDTVPFGGWDLPINFELLADGGRCSPGCHEPREYHREAAEIRPLRENVAAPGEVSPES